MFGDLSATKMKSRNHSLVPVFFLFFSFYSLSVSVPGYSECLAKSFEYPLDPYTKTSYYFAQKVGGEYHAGQDCKGGGGTKVYAVSDGTISFSGSMGGYGWLITVDHPSDNVYSLYGHLSTRRWKKTSGNVDRGEHIGYLADDDEDGGSWGPHLHFGIRKGQISDYPNSGYNRWMCGYTDRHPSEYKWYDPSEYIKEHSSAGDPDLNVERVEISQAGKNDWKHSITVESGQSFKFDIETKIENKGEGDTDDDIEIEYYLSEDKDFDKGDDIRLGKDVIDELDSGKDHEDHKRNLQAPSKTGTYYIFVYIDYDKDEEHKSNNYSSDSDKDEYAVLTVVTGNQKPVGYLDVADCTHIAGWARDPDTTNAINVHFYRDGPSGTGTYMGSITADKYRGDLPFSDKNHGYDITTPDNLKDGKIHAIYAYAIDSSGGTNPLLGSSSIVCAGETAYGMPVYRFWNDDTNDHFYTISESERDKLIEQGEYKYEGIEFYAFDSNEADTSPIYRLWSSSRTDHHYTASAGEKDKLLGIEGWEYEKVAFYAYTFQEIDTKPVYRLNNSKVQDHFFTASASEKDKAIATGQWVYEGIAWYVPTENMTPPTSKFSMTPNSGIGSIKTTFTNNSTGSIKTYKWTFGDGATSTLKNPTHTYTTPGIYSVKLEVYGPRSWTSETTKKDAITVYSQACSAFSATPKIGAAPLSVLFSDQSTGDIEKWEWTFGDGNTGNAQSPIHKYDQPGKYTVTLKVSGNGGTDTETKSDFVVVTTSCPNCDGANPTIDNIILYDGSECKCTGSDSVTIGPNVTLKKGSKLTVNSKKISVKAEVHAEDGAVLDLKSQ